MMETVVRVFTLCGWWEERVTLYSDYLSYSHVRLFVTQWAIHNPSGSSVPGILPGDIHTMSPAFQGDSLPLSFRATRYLHMILHIIVLPVHSEGGR